MIFGILLRFWRIGLVGFVFLVWFVNSFFFFRHRHGCGFDQNGGFTGRNAGIGHEGFAVGLFKLLPKAGHTRRRRGFNFCGRRCGGCFRWCCFLFLLFLIVGFFFFLLFLLCVIFVLLFVVIIFILMIIPRVLIAVIIIIFVISRRTIFPILFFIFGRIVIFGMTLVTMVVIFSGVWFGFWSLLRFLFLRIGSHHDSCSHGRWYFSHPHHTIVVIFPTRIFSQGGILRRGSIFFFGILTVMGFQHHDMMMIGL
mmetsp:Transcript_4699/g.10024  ORF Transcript_4699/g.10024 Transcript_4699/m.10024 type:complete len:253 (-) Transcript_4699:365-1123(-)